MFKPTTLIVVTLAVVGSIVNNYNPAMAFSQPQNNTIQVVSETKTPSVVRKTLASRSSRPNMVTVRIQLGTPTHNKIYAKFFIKQKYGWGKKEYRCLVNLWNRESGWSHEVENKTSGAYGIPQSLPGDKMASAGKDWKTNPATQIKWGAKYIKTRYGTPCDAYAFFKTKNWY